MWLLVGLGNPGSEYAQTRHNIGFMVLDLLADLMAEKSGAADSWRAKFGGLFLKGRLDDEPVVLLKPMKYMNCSGEVVVPAMGFFQIEPTEVLCIHDELDLSFGRMQVRKGGGTAGHKGIMSVAEQLGRTDFGRVRVGIGRPPHGNTTPHVLGGFSTEERARLPEFVKAAADAARAVVRDGMTAAMNRYNKRPGSLLPPK